MRQLLNDPGETDPVQLAFLELLSLGRFDYVRGHLDAAAATGRRCVAVAPAPDHPLALGGHTLLCCVRRQRGEFRDAVGHAEEVARHYDARVHGRLALDMTDDPFIVTRTYAGDSLAALGQVEEARAHFRAASDAAVTLGIPFCAAFAPMSSTYGHLMLQDVDAARQALDTVDALSTQHGFAYLLGNAWSLRGWLETLEGCTRDRTRQERLELVARFETGLQAYEANGIVIGRAVLQAWFALAVHQSGDTERALRIVDEAIRLAEGMGAFGDAMPPHLIRGDLCAASGRLDDALASYERVLTLAQRSAARLFELMAATRLVRLSRTAALDASRLNSSAASARLAAICDWFTEGVDILPLRDARALLASSPSASARRPRTRR